MTYKLKNIKTTKEPIITFYFHFTIEIFLWSNQVTLVFFLDVLCKNFSPLSCLHPLLLPLRDRQPKCGGVST